MLAKMLHQMHCLSARSQAIFACLLPRVVCGCVCVCVCILSLSLARSQEGGANPVGTMSTRKFMSALVLTFRTFEITREVLDTIEAAYGCGYRDVRGKFENAAWKDFCEDVEKSLDYDSSNGVAEALAATRGAKITFAALSDNHTIMQSGFVPRDPKGAQLR